MVRKAFGIVVCIAAIGVPVARAQQGDSRPTFVDRLGNVTRSLFGDDEPPAARPRGSAGPQRAAAPTSRRVRPPDEAFVEPGYDAAPDAHPHGGRPNAAGVPTAAQRPRISPSRSVAPPRAASVFPRRDAEDLADEPTDEWLDEFADNAVTDAPTAPPVPRSTAPFSRSSALEPTTMPYGRDGVPRTAQATGTGGVRRDMPSTSRTSNLPEGGASYTPHPSTAAAEREAPTGSSRRGAARDAAPVTQPVDTSPRTAPRTARSQRPATLEDWTRGEGNDTAGAADSPSGSGSASSSGSGRGRGDDDLLFTRKSPVIGIQTAGPRSTKIGATTPYRIVVQNSGEVAANDLIVAVQIPEWVEVVGADPSTGITRPAASGSERAGLEWVVKELAPRGQVVLDLAIIPRKSRPLDLAVSWTHSPVVSQAVVEVQEPKVMLTVSGPDEVHYGRSEVYKLTLTNPGSGEAENVTIRLLPSGAGDESAQTHRVGTLRAGETQVLELEVTPRDAGPLWIKAEAVADGGLRSEVAREIVVRRAALEVVIEGPQFHYAGAVANYTIHVINTGNSTADSVRVAAMLPAGTTFVSASDGGRRDGRDNQVTWSVGTLRAQAEQVVHLKCRLGQPGENRMQVAAEAADDVRQSVFSMTHVEALADLVLVVSDPPGPTPVGREAVYELRVKNRGTKSAEHVDVVAYFTEGIEPTAGEGAPHEIGPGQIKFDTIPRLAPGAEVVLRIVAEAQVAGNHMFRAEVHCEQLGAKLATEETTRFYGEQPQPRGAARPATLPSSGGADHRGHDDEGIAEPPRQTIPPAPVAESDGF